MAQQAKEGGTIRLLTYNTWGLKYVSKFRSQRLKAIADLLADVENKDYDYDIVALQEVWCEEDWNYIDKVCGKKYRYRRQFKSGIVAGPGLVILSKIAIEESFLYRFPINGRPSAFFRGDWYVGKGIAVTLLKPVNKNCYPLAILNSHMHAPYGPFDKSYSCHRACQAWDFTRIINMLKKAGYAVIQVGDLNSKPGSLPHRLFTIEAGLKDSWDQCHPDSDNHDISKLSPQDQVNLAGVTCDSRLNTWTQNKKPHEACRLDYALIDSSLIKSFDPQVEFTQLLPSPLNCSYSDHFAYSVNLDVSQKIETNVMGNDITYEEKVKVYIDLLEEIAHYRRHTIPFQSQWRKYHFCISIIIIISLHVLVFLTGIRSRSMSGFILFLAVIVGITGVVNGLIWYLGVRSEDRALQEVYMQVEDSLSALKTAHSN